MNDEKPTKMSIGDAARLDRAMLHLRELDKLAKEYRDEIAEVCSANGISIEEMNSGAVRVNMKTGEFTRATQKVAP